MSKSYPIGSFLEPAEITSEQRNLWMEELVQIPELTRNLVSHLNDEQLETPYRSGGWTLKQVVHHIADANMNSYIHYKLALTEENPQIKPYDEERWVELPDEKNEGVELSLLLLKTIIARWGSLLRSMTDSQFSRTFVHPVNGQRKLDAYLGFCVWHSKHHLAQIKHLLAANNWE